MQPGTVLGHEAVGVVEDGDQWVPGDAPSLAARWAVDTVAKAGTIGVPGVYPPEFAGFPFGKAMNKNLTIHMLKMVGTGGFDPTAFITQHEKPTAAVEAYETFDRRVEGWVKTVLDVAT